MREEERVSQSRVNDVNLSDLVRLDVGRVRGREAVGLVGLPVALACGAWMSRSANPVALNSATSKDEAPRPAAQLAEYTTVTEALT